MITETLTEAGIKVIKHEEFDNFSVTTIETDDLFETIPVLQKLALDFIMEPTSDDRIFTLKKTR